MDVIVTEGTSVLRRLLDVWDGEIVAPGAVEEMIAELGVSNADTMVERLAVAALADFRDLPRALAALPGLTAEETVRLSRRLGWIVKTFAEWDPRADRSGLRIEAALASVAFWNADGTFWDEVRSYLQECLILMAGLEAVVRARAAQAQVPGDAPVWEREHLHAMQDAERAGDWAELGERTRAFQRLPRLDPGACQATLGLSHLDWPRLVRVANRCQSWLHGHLLLEPLPLKDALRLSTASTSGYVRFTVLERVAYREVRDLQPDEDSALRNLLIVLAKDTNEWPRWLAICNHYPVRHPHMQAAFGRALARSDEAALQAYVESIWLILSDHEGRENVTRCLSVFRAQADVARRVALWRAAFDRWQAWDFGRSDGTNLSGVARSAVDYGVVGWLVEGEPRRSPIDLERSFEEDLRALDARWHASISSAVSDFHRLVSRYQVLAHAVRRSAGDADWLPGPAMCLPRAADPFHRRRYHWNDR